MKPQAIPAIRTSPFRQVARPDWRSRPEANKEFTAAARFATDCAALPGAAILNDVVVDGVALNFGPMTQEICDRLNNKGWIFLRTTERREERVLDVSFSGNGRAEATAKELADDLAKIFGEIDVAEARLW